MENLLTFIVPIKDEYKNATELMARLKKSCANDYTVIFVYDEEDSSVKMLKQDFASEEYVIFLQNKYKTGFSNAIKTGIYHVNSDYFIATMGDNSDDVTQIDAMLKMAIDENLDIVAPSRYVKQGAYKGGMLLKKTISRLANLSLFLLKKMPITDITNDFKLYKTESIRKLEIESSLSFDIGMELTVKVAKNGGKIKEIPTVWLDRTEGKSKFYLSKHVIPYLRWYFQALRIKSN